MDTTTQLFLGVLFGAIGTGYMLYGRRQMNGMALISGLGLCAFSYFVSSLWLTLLIAAVLMAAPFFIEF